MNGLLWWLGQNTITVAVIIPLVLLACRRLRNRPAVQHVLWLVVLLKLVTPPVVTWPWGSDDLGPLLGPAPIQTERSATESVPREVDRAIAAKPLSEYRAADPKPKGPTLAPTFPEDPVERTWFLPQIIAGIWVIGAAICGLWQLRRIGRHASLIRRSVVAPPELADEVRAAARQLRLRPPRAVVAPGILSPFVWCLGRLRLVWPASLAGPADVARSRGVIAHELAHLRRGDHWVAWLELAAGIVWWWNPMYWFVRRRLRETAEMACDALAIAANPAGRREYAELFLELSAGFKSGAPAPVLAVSAGTPSSFERRLSMILSDKVSGKVSKWGLLAAGFLALAALPGWSPGQPKQPPKSAADDQQLRDLIEKGRFAEAKDRLETLRKKQTGDGEFSPKWKDILAKELPDACRKGLPKDAAPAWKQCLSCHAPKSAVADNAKDWKVPADGKVPEGKYDLMLKMPDTSWREKRVVDPSAGKPFIGFKGSRHFYEMFLDETGATLTAGDAESGKMLWKSRFADKLAGQSRHDKWTLDESPDGKLVLLAWHWKDGRTTFTFDAAAGKIVRQDKVGAEATLPPKSADSSKPDADMKAKVPAGDPLTKAPTGVRWEENLTGTLDLAERYLKAIADMKKARSRYDRISKLGSAVSHEVLDEAQIELERADAQAKFTTAVLSDAVKSARAAKDQADEALLYAKRTSEKGFLSATELDTARVRRDQAESRLKQLESIMPQSK